MELKNRYFTVLDALPEHIFVFSESGIYIDVYGGDDNAMDFDCKPFIGKSLYDVAPPDMASDFHRHIKNALATNETQVAIYKMNKQEIKDLADVEHSANEVWFQGMIKPLPIIENGERTVVWAAKNITQRHLLEQRLKTLSEIDDLTKIANRRHYTYTLNTALKNYQLFSKNFSLLIVDIDRFKRINDNFGHHSGDEAIQHTVQTLKGSLRESDFLARIGGEEFAIILYNTDIEQAHGVADKLRASIENRPFFVANQQIDLTVSIGVTQVAEEDTDTKNIMVRADQAMYHAKRLGRNKVCSHAICHN